MRYFVNHQTRLVRTTDDWDKPPPEPWTEATGGEYDQFRDRTQKFFTTSDQKEARKLGNGMELKLKGIKRRATKMKKAAHAEGKELTHSQALEIVAKEAGYRNYHEAQKVLGGLDG
jgi:hypothetical protein